MSKTLCLNGTWGLTWAEGSPLMPPKHYTAESLRGRKLLPAAVPAPIHQVLTDAGLIDDVNVGLNSLKARWVEEQFWIYRHVFTLSAEEAEEAARQSAWLTFDLLEFDATVRLNGEVVGQHVNANRPARFEVTGKLRPGDNLLVVEISTGLHANADKPGSEYGLGPTDIESITKRVFMRKPQYQSGWDWNPRLGNVGILGDVCLEWREGPRLDEMAVFAIVAPDLSRATIVARGSVVPAGKSSEPATLRVRVVETGQEASVTIPAGSGETRPELRIDIDQPKLWWPIGHGEQSRYTVEVTLTSGAEEQTITRKTGVRRLEIDQSAHPVEGTYFIIKVNNRPIFCKGGNWIPADLLYSTVTEARYRELVRLAVEANFNILRIWGGGLFATHALCEACDEAGLLIWHDFLFACGKYPGDDPAWTAEARRELTHAVRDLAHHPSLTVWCGNNEIEWGDWAWAYDAAGRTHPHYALFHHDIPLIVRTEDPSTLHWISSPFSPDQRFPNDPTVGDQHPWNVSLLEPGGADWWKYRGYVDRFPNEGGVLGASSPATLRQFLPSAEQSVGSPSWDHHDNSFATIDSVPGNLGHAYQTVELWLGRDPLALSLDDYAFASGLLQAEGLQEYVANYRRRMFSSSSAIFWMYNDSWPVTNGWTIVDYYLRKKLAYHPVRRAFQPITVVVAEDESRISIFGVNDSPTDWTGEVRFGLFTLAGALPKDERKPVVLAANASTILASFDRSALAALGTKQAGAFAVLVKDGRNVAQHRLFVERFRALQLVEPRISATIATGAAGGEAVFTTDAFAWGVCIDLDGEAALADNCFDLLPGVEYRVPWPASQPAPRVLRVGNELLQSAK